MKWENILQQDLARYDYNTFGSYVEFYQNYTKSKQQLFDYILNYQARITTESMSCVALSIYLRKHLIDADQNNGSLFSLVSCEEMILISADVSEASKHYQLESKENVKEHVMLCLKFRLLDESRCGYVLLDPGYHVARPIVVMQDMLYPHTGWFIASNTKSLKEYYYQIVNDQYIAWQVRESSKGQKPEVLREYINIIYIEKEFAKYANVTEKRALIFSMKSYVVRSRKGVIAGFYSRIDHKNLTIFYEENGERVNRKFHVDEIGNHQVRAAITKVASSMESCVSMSDINRQVDRFLALLINYKQSLYDADFCPDLCQIDKWIEE